MVIHLLKCRLGADSQKIHREAWALRNSNNSSGRQITQKAALKKPLQRISEQWQLDGNVRVLHMQVCEVQVWALRVQVRGVRARECCSCSCSSFFVIALWLALFSHSSFSCATTHRLFSTHFWSFGETQGMRATKVDRWTAIRWRPERNFWSILRCCLECASHFMLILSVNSILSRRSQLRLSIDLVA